MDAGDVVVLPFPYSNLASRKLRPALVLSPAWYHAKRDDALLAFITSVRQDDPFAVALTQQQLADGSLARPSWIRTDKLFTLDQALVRKTVARLAPDALEQVRDTVCAFVRGDNVA